jgi:hypothetical protein
MFPADIYSTLLSASSFYNRRDSLYGPFGVLRPKFKFQHVGNHVKIKLKVKKNYSGSFLKFVIYPLHVDRFTRQIASLVEPDLAMEEQEKEERLQFSNLLLYLPR